jgi:hypothetical protein
MSGLTTSQRAIFNDAAAQWSQIIMGDLPDVLFNGQVIDDVLITASAVPIDGVSGILGQAGPTNLRSGSYLPFRGNMQFDSADMANMEANGTLRYVILHELGHVLGVGTIWTDLGLLGRQHRPRGSEPSHRGQQIRPAGRACPWRTWAEPARAITTFANRSSATS